LLFGVLLEKKGNTSNLLFTQNQFQEWFFNPLNAELNPI
jgi:hypothetical protein